MARKSDTVVSYIESLPVGAKISVRGLSAALGVSEGTAYKAIKGAETCGLVVTRPKTGTYRIDSSVSVPAHEATIGLITQTLGLTILAGAQHTDDTVGCVVVGDGDEANLREAIGARREAGTVLCVVGNRPDIQEAAVRAGAHLLITGGSRPQEGLIISAERNGVCVLLSLQGSYQLLRLFQGYLPGAPAAGVDGAAGDWMQVPHHLFCNDIAADWHRLYRSIPPIAAQYPVVNEELEICGALDVAKAFAANPSQKVSGLLTEPADCIRIGPDVPMQEIAERMVLTGKSLAAVTRAGEMCGLITANDILRYYLFSGRDGARYKFGSFLEETGYDGDKGLRMFNVRFPEDELANFSEFSVLIMLAAAQRHAEAVFGQRCRLESGTFFATDPEVTADGLMLSSTVSRACETYCSIEVEMCCDIRSYTKAVLMFSRA